MDSPPGFPHTLLEWVNRPPGYQEALQVWGRLSPAGENVLRDDWDLCIVLDACRADLLENALEDGWAPPAEYEYDTMTSLESATEPWIEQTFSIDPEEVDPVTFVCSNPFSTAARDSPVVETLDEVWQYGWDRDLRTVPPSVVTDRAVHHCRESDERVIAHYLQPHMPAIRSVDDRSTATDDEQVASDGGPAASGSGGATAGEDERATSDGEPAASDDGGSSAAGRPEPPELERCFEPYGESHHDGPDTWLEAAGHRTPLEHLRFQFDWPNDDPGGMFEGLRWGHVDHDEAWGAYRDALDVVLEEVELLLRSVDADDVLITADHGNAFGEWGFYAHPYHLPLSVLREMPTVRTAASAELDYEPVNDCAVGVGDGDEASVTDEELEERLAALGYA